MSFSNKFVNIFKAFLPAPFTIAVLLTGLTFLLAWVLTQPQQDGWHFIELLENWEKGLWDGPLLVFALQMMLMLVLGHVLALTEPINKLIEKASVYCNTTANAAAIVTLLTLMVSFFNWGLGLIFGAIFARKVGEQAVQNNTPLHYPLIGAAGYSGMMVWHGGISGSAPIKIAEEGHFMEAQMGVISQSDTIFSSMNIVLCIILLIVLPSAMYLIGKRSKDSSLSLPIQQKTKRIDKISGAEKLDHSRLVAYLFGGVLLMYAFYKAFIKPDFISLSFITPNYINLVLLATGIVLHGSIYKYLRGIDDAIGGASGILIQFPLYFGIMGIMKYSGMVGIFSDFFVQISNEATFPIFTFISAGIVNVFVPSGGGQWGVQGPIIIEAASQLNVPYWKAVMSLAYGDQITNMLQPFWALPLLGITGLKAKEILPYTLLLLLIGSIIFITGLLIF